MSHFSKSKESARATPREWLPIGATVGDIVNGWSGRGDLVTLIGPDAGSGAPACFKPAIAEIEMNTSVAFGEGVTPAMIGDLADRTVQFEWPVACGALLHEAMHSKYSLWDLEALDRVKDKRVVTLVTLFEETRIECRGVETYPLNRSFLRACAMGIVLDDMDEEKKAELRSAPAMGISQMMLLSWARVDAGVLDEDDVTDVVELITEAFGEDLCAELRKLWIAAQDVRDDYSFTEMQKLAERWIELLDEAGHKTLPDHITIRLTPGGEEDGDGGGSLGDILDEILESLPDIVVDIEIDAREEGLDRAEHERRERVNRENEKAVAEHKESEKKAKEVFGAGTGPAPYAKTSSHLVERRPPRDSERMAAVTIGKMLDKARYRDRETTVHSDIVPPGRLRGRAAVQAQAERQRGLPARSEPWRRKARRMVEDPKLKLAVMVDISGSMSGAMEPMATTAWVFSEAARRIQATVAMAYYGDSVFATLKPGQHLDQVMVYSAPDGTEYFEPAFKAVDGAVGLLNGSGARLLVIVSDMVYTGYQTDRAQHYVKRCLAEGVAVMILPYSSHRHYGAYRDPFIAMGVTVLDKVTSPTDAAMAIGRAAADALTKAGARVG